MYRYETHLHTSPCSRCGKASVRESLEFYKKLGYDGVFITNHFVDRIFFPELSYEERIEKFFADYEEGVQIGKELGIRVFCGAEVASDACHFLVYGLDKQWYLAHPEILELSMSKKLKLMIAEGALTIHAHPFRHEEDWISRVELYPKVTHGVEVYNASRKGKDNLMAEHYANVFGFPVIAGSDNHTAGKRSRFGGIETEVPIESEQHFKELFFDGKINIFKLDNPYWEKPAT